MTRFDRDIERLEIFLGVPVAAEDVRLASAYDLRFYTLLYRARLIVLEESSRILVTLRTMRNDSRHTSVMVEGIQRLTVREAKEYLVGIHRIVVDCRAKNLKRLEVEARLIQLCFYVLLRNLGQNSDLNVHTSIDRILHLCQTYPDTAGLLSHLCNTVKEVIAGVRSEANFYTKELESTWWVGPKWPVRQVTHIEYCRYGHIYSNVETADCPECGRKVQKSVPVNSNAMMDPEAFLAAAKTHNFKSMWRAQ